MLKDLKGIHKSSDRSIMSPVGLGLNFRVIGMDAGFRYYIYIYIYTY